MELPDWVWRRLLERPGVDRGAAAAAVIAERPGVVVVDQTHPGFPAMTGAREPNQNRQPPVLGPGGHLKRLLARFGIKATGSGCKCTSRAAEMDRNGCEWVEANIDTVVAWLREEAHKRGLPFVDALAKMLIREAVRRARKDAAANARGSQRQD